LTTLQHQLDTLSYRWEEIAEHAHHVIHAHGFEIDKAPPNSWTGRLAIMPSWDSLDLSGSSLPSLEDISPTVITYELKKWVTFVPMEIRPEETGQALAMHHRGPPPRNNFDFRYVPAQPTGRPHWALPMWPRDELVHFMHLASPTTSRRVKVSYLYRYFRGKWSPKRARNKTRRRHRMEPIPIRLLRQMVWSRMGGHVDAVAYGAFAIVNKQGIRKIIINDIGPPGASVVCAAQKLKGNTSISHLYPQSM
jgi:hypothetical protein